MCFSATASFTAGTFLLGAGIMTLGMTRRPAERAYAAIPLLFAIQQLSEGLLWWAFGSGPDGLIEPITQFYSFFSHVLWPIYVPLAVLLIEPQVSRRRRLIPFIAAGTAVGLYLLYEMFANPITAAPVGQHIEYRSPHFYIAIVIILYLAATTLSQLMSSHRTVQLFGVVALVSAVVAYIFLARWFISVWCFFAAVLSILVCLHFASRRTAIEGVMP